MPPNTAAVSALDIAKEVLDDPYSLQLAGTYKSLTDLNWEQIPPLAIVTGENGVGKTQFLQALASGFAAQSGAGRPVSVRMTGFQLRPSEVHLYSDTSEIGPSIAVPLLQTGGQRENRQGPRKDPGVTSGPGSTRSPHPWLPTFGQDLLPPKDVLTAVANLFQQYRYVRLERLEEKVPESEIRDTIGVPPWESLNEILHTANFPYRVVEPLGSISAPYFFRLRSRDGEFEIPPTDLSSGERVILRTVLWLYGANFGYSAPKLLLLDEPDAHLHPSLAKSFLDVVNGVLVRGKGVRVIMTTHSPATVALAPEGSIFEMYREEPRIRLAPSRWHATSLLTAGLIGIGPNAKYIFVEGRDDVRFYEATERVLRLPPPLSGSEPPLSPDGSLVFIPASEGQVSGGASQVRKWVKMIANPAIRGIVDGDRGAMVDDRVNRLTRYEHENYLVDPVVVYAALANIRQAPDITGVTRPTFGGEVSLRTRQATEIQAIADFILRRLAETVFSDDPPDDIDLEHCEVQIVAGPTLRYPKWFLQKKGKTFIGQLQRLFGKELQRENLLLAYERIGWVPRDILSVLQEAQRA